MKRKSCHYDGAMTLPVDYLTKPVFVNPTPKHWEKLAIEKDGERYNLRHAMSRVKIVEGMLKQAKLPIDLRRECLSLPEALKVGEIMDQAFRLLR